MSAAKYDLIVIGSGPSGQRAAVAATKMKKRVAVVEARSVVGGVCINTATDVNNCGGCGKVCTGTAPDCVNGACCGSGTGCWRGWPMISTSSASRRSPTR